MLTTLISHRYVNPPSLTRRLRRQYPWSRQHHTRSVTWVWLSTTDLLLQVDSHRLAPHFVGLFEIDRIIKPLAVRLKLTPSMKVHPTFHVSLLEPVSTSKLQPPPCTMDGHPVYSVSYTLSAGRAGVQTLS